MCKIDYPQEILPKDDYVKEGFSLDGVVNDYPDICISRRIDDDVEKYVDEDEGCKHLDTDCFGEYYEHLSVNLMNSLFRNEHIKYQAKGDAGKKWQGQPVSLKDYEAHVSVHEDSTAVFYKVSSLHKRTFRTKLSLEKGPYNAMHEALKKKALAAFNPPKTDVDFDGNVSIDHIPANLNYWHCQVEIYPKDVDKSLQNAKSWRQDIFTHVMTNILSYDFATEAESEYVIDEKYYKKA